MALVYSQQIQQAKFDSRQRYNNSTVHETLMFNVQAYIITKLNVHDIALHKFTPMADDLVIGDISEMSVLRCGSFAYIRRHICFLYWVCGMSPYMQAESPKYTQMMQAHWRTPTLLVKVFFEDIL